MLTSGARPRRAVQEVINGARRTRPQAAGSLPTGLPPITCVARDGGFDLLTLLRLLNTYTRVEFVIGIKNRQNISKSVTYSINLFISEYFTGWVSCTNFLARCSRRNGGTCIAVRPRGFSIGSYSEQPCGACRTICARTRLLNAYARIELFIGFKVSSRISETDACGCGALTVSEYFARRL
jgi:hypothetical protein